MATLATTLPHEEALVAHAQADQAAFAAVYDHFFQRVYNYARYRISDPDVADDVTAQIFEQVLRHLPEYRAGRGPFAAWLFRIARNAIYDQLRRGQHHLQVSLDTLENQISDQSGPDEKAEERLRRAHLLALIATLTDREQEIIALKFGAGLTNRRIADLMKLNEGHVAVILYRALQTLRRKLSAEGGSA